MFGILNLNKPTGWTSRDVVNRVQRLVRPDKVGHAGTLDPLATGVLVVCVGPTTRLIEYIQQMPKTYEATFLLGRTSPTEDVQGEVTPLVDAPVPSLAELRTAAARLVGQISQRPPAFSALKVGGRRSYALARAGEAVELQPRMVEVHALSVDRLEYPEVEVSVRCGSGTYVRSLGRDLAESLGTGAVMSRLQRTSIGQFCVGESADVQSLDGSLIASLLQSPREAVLHLSQTELDADQVAAVRQGKQIAVASHLAALSGEIAATDKSGQLVAILREKGLGKLSPTRVFPPTD